ncbi:MAG: hypothetical protein Q8Q10_04885 [bacterium]|nr:hypothetical protein [bacterium]
MMKAKVMGVKGKEKPRGQWFMECGNFSNESVQRELAEWGISDYESKHPKMPGSDGKKHDVIEVPSSFVKKARDAKQTDERFKFRFWKRNSAKGKIYPADFVEQPRTTKKISVARKGLAKMRATKKR